MEVAVGVAINSGERADLSDFELLADFAAQIRVVYAATGGRRPPRDCRFERRASVRIRVRSPIFVAPIGIACGRDCQPTKEGEPIDGFTRDLSLKGVGFVHQQPVNARRVIITFGASPLAPLSLVVDIRWTRQCKNGTYRTGAKFRSLVQAAPSTNRPIQA